MLELNTLSSIAYNRFIDEQFDTGIEDDGRIFNKALPSDVPVQPGSVRPMISRSPYAPPTGTYHHNILTKLSQQGFRVSQRFLDYVADTFPRNSEQRKNWQDAIKRTFRALYRKRGQLIYCDTFYDWRGRVYHMSGEWGSLQNNKLSRAALSAPEPVSVDTESLNYMLKIFEHEGWPTDIKAARNYLDNPQFDGNGALDWMAVRAALAIVEIASTSKTDYLLEQDATCSGFQHMALLMSDMKLARAVNVIDCETEGDLYTEVAEAGSIAEQLFNNDARKARQFSKKIVMLTGYGSGANGIASGYWLDAGGNGELTDEGIFVPDEESTIFIGTKEFHYDELIEFVKACQQIMLEEFESIAILRNLCVQYFSDCMINDKSEFAWTAPDGFIAKRLITEDEQAKQAVGAAGAMPNLVHSLDAAVVRHVIHNWDGVLGVVHDAFFTTPDNALQLRQAVQNAYVAIHSNLGDYPIKRHQAMMPIGRCIGVSF